MPSFKGREVPVEAIEKKKSARPVRFADFTSTRDLVHEIGFVHCSVLPHTAPFMRSENTRSDQQHAFAALVQAAQACARRSTNQKAAPEILARVEDFFEARVCGAGALAREG